MRLTLPQEHPNTNHEKFKKNWLKFDFYVGLSCEEIISVIRCTVVISTDIEANMRVITYAMV